MNKRSSLEMVLSFLLASSLTACGGAGGAAVPASNGSLTAQTSLAANALVPRATAAVSSAATGSIAMDAGSSAAPANWLNDSGYTTAGLSGVEFVSRAIDTSRVTNPAPQAVYQTQRYAAQLTYAMPNLTPGARYNVRLHFVESFFGAAQKRVFGAAINGVQVLTNFDIFATAGGANIALVQQFVSSADATGKITVKLTASVNNASIAGIEVIAAPATPAPTPTPVSTAYADANLPPASWQFPYSPNPFTVPACTSDPCSPVIDSNSAAEVTGVMAGKALDLGDIYQGYPGDNDFPVYYASASDPLYTVSCEGGCGTGTISVRIPNGAYASAGSDHHLDVISLATGVETSFWEFNDNHTGTGTTNPVSGGGSISSGSGGVCTITAFAGNVNSCANSSEGSGLPQQPQILDPREILAGNISHTLYVALGCGQKNFTFPAKYSDGYCAAGPKYGQRLWLDLTDAQINALGDPAWATTMLHAMHHYGWVVSDNNGGSSGVDFAELGSASFTLWGLADPWKAFWAATGTGDYVTIPTRGISASNVHVLAPL
jgi:hypothetical protein